MGPNGAGKTTLSAVVMGRPGYEVLEGSVTLDGVDVLAMPAVGAGRRRAAPRDAVPDRGARRRARRHAARGARGPRRGPSTGSTARLRGRGRRGSASSRGCSTARSTSTCPAARRSATRRCSSPCSGRGSPSSTSSTRGSTSTPCGRAPAGSRPRPSRPPASPGSACWRSPTTTGCCRSCAPIRSTSSCAGSIVADRAGPSWPTGWRPRATPPSPASRRTAPRPSGRTVRPGSLDELFASG